MRNCHLSRDKRPIVILALLLSPLGVSCLFGQDPNLSFDPWANSIPPAWAAADLGYPHHEEVEPRLAPIPSDPVPTGQAALVSVEELRHPLSKKGQKLLAKAQNAVRAGDHAKALEALNLAMQEPSAVPYAHGILGTEYLKLRKIPEAIQQLKEAIALMPKTASHHSNLGFALCLLGQSKQALQEINTALSLDWTLVRARFLKGVILLDQGVNDQEAWDDLQVAQREVPTAHLALAIYYVRHGQEAAADQQLRDYADLNLGVTLLRARKWLAKAGDFAPTRALGLWSPSSASGE